MSATRSPSTNTPRPAPPARQRRSRQSAAPGREQRFPTRGEARLLATGRRRSAARGLRRQRLLEVCPEVLDVLAADAHADQPVRDVLLARVDAAALLRGLDAAQARRVPDDPDRGAGAV